MKTNQTIKFLFITLGISFLIFISNPQTDSVEVFKNHNFNKSDSKDRLGLADLPGNFTLSSDKDEINEDDPIILSWTNSSGADNYSIYEFEGFNILIISGLTNNSYNIPSIEIGTHLYFAVSYNESGQTNSNTIEIKRNTNLEDKDDAEAATDLLFFIYQIPLVIGFIIITIVAISLSVSYNKKRHKFEPYDYFQRKTKASIAVARKETYYKQQNGNHLGPNHINQQAHTKPAKELIKEKVDNTSLLRIVKKENLDKELQLTSISENYLNKIDRFHWKSEAEKFQFIHEMSALSLEEREDVLDYMFQKEALDELSD